MGPATAPPSNPSPSTAEIEPWDVGLLAVGDGHMIHFEQCGTPGGAPVLFLHGGPGSGCSIRHRGLLNAARFRIVLFDQRGCGLSTPHGDCEHNTTAELVEDIERLRARLGIDRWLVHGGSWGAALAIAYCAAHRDACLGAILRGIFLTGPSDLEWFFHAAGELVPDAWLRFASALPGDDGRSVAERLFDAVNSVDRAIAHAAVRNWMQWEEALETGIPAPAVGIADNAATEASLAKYRVQAHYLRHHCFLGDRELLRRAGALAGLPVAILHGRQDRVCRPGNALRLHRAIPGSRLQFVDGASHSPFAPAMTRALATAAAHHLAHGDFGGWGEDFRGD